MEENACGLQYFCTRPHPPPFLKIIFSLISGDAELLLTYCSVLVEPEKVWSVQRVPVFLSFLVTQNDDFVVVDFFGKAVPSNTGR